MTTIQEEIKQLVRKLYFHGVNHLNVIASPEAEKEIESYNKQFTSALQRMQSTERAETLKYALRQIIANGSADRKWIIEQLTIDYSKTTGVNLPKEDILR